MSSPASAAADGDGQSSEKPALILEALSARFGDAVGDARPRPLRVHVITEDDPLYVIRFFDVFLSEYPRDAIDVVGITIARPFRESSIATARRMMRFYGAFEFARVVGQFAAAKARRRSIASLARRHGVPVVPTPSVNEADFVRRLAEEDLDVILSVAAPEIFRPPLLSVPRIAAINLHSGRLPDYRGMMPTFWQMLNGEDVVTVTVHEMAPELDGGRILGTAECPVHERDSLHRMMELAKVEGARLVIRTLQAIASAAVSPEDIDVAHGTYRSFPAPEDVRRFRARGHRLL
jgi:methionyl-tRNA formyltransferase